MQDFLNKAAETVKQNVNKAADKTGELVEITKLKSKISTARSEIEESQKKIGQHYFDRYLSDEDVDPAIAHICDDIKMQMDKIDQLEDQIKIVKENKK